MNGFEIMSAGVKQMVEKGRMTAEQGAKKCRVYDFLSECDQEDFCALFDSGAFNTIAEGYATATARFLESEGILSRGQAERLPRIYHSMYEDYDASEAYDLCQGKPLLSAIEAAKDDVEKSFLVWARYPTKDAGEQIYSGSFAECQDFCLNADLGVYEELNICSNDGKIVMWYKTPSGQEFPDGEICQENAELIPHIDDDSGVH